MGLTIVDGPTIAQNESLSDGVDCTGGSIVRITVLQEFTDANLTFQASSNGELYNDLYDTDGNEVTLPVKPDTTVVIAADWTLAIAGSNSARARAAPRSSRRPIADSRSPSKHATHHRRRPWTPLQSYEAQLSLQQ